MSLYTFLAIHVVGIVVLWLLSAYADARDGTYSTLEPWMAFFIVLWPISIPMFAVVGLIIGFMWLCENGPTGIHQLTVNVMRRLMTKEKK